MTWREYHESTKHTADALRRMQHVLDWKNMPDPFRHYDGVPILDLPADPPAPGDLVADGPALLSQLLFYSAAISASKRVPAMGYRYALRVNPSSGNLHPTEFHFFTRGLRDWPDGLYHYRPSSHMAEQRALGEIDMDAGDASPVTFVLTSIAWREAWKYRDRAYRYCLLDIGHAWQALALAAEAAGCHTSAVGHFPDDAVAQTCRLNSDEWPMLVVKLYGVKLSGSSIPASDTVWFGGQANQLSERQIDYRLIDEIHAATKRSQRFRISADSRSSAGRGEIHLPPPASSTRPFGEVARARRSALDFRGGTNTISLPQLSALLAAASQPLAADFPGARFIQLYLYVHRVEGLDPGVYRYWPPSDGRQPAGLERTKSGDQRVAAAGLSLGQDLAGNACVAFSMIADIDRAVDAFGDRGYRYVHFEAGAIGHRLYIAAEALGLGATGIGAFFDDQVHRYLELTSGQVVYHFAIGYPVPDPRIAG